MKKIKNALISVSNKNNLKKLLSTLSKYKIELISSGGTFKKIKKLRFNCIEISKYTNSPEILNGRVKTLHPKIHGGILSKRNNKSHKKDLLKNNIHEIDLVIVNFYPFEKTLNTSKNHSKIIENIDIGGPTMVRAAAKNYNDVVVITDPIQYDDLIKELNFNFFICLNVPPELINFILCLESVDSNFFKLFLFETEIKALLIFFILFFQIPT